MTECNDRVLDYPKITHGMYILKLKDGTGLEEEGKKVNTMPLHLGVSVLSNSKKNYEQFYTCNWWILHK